MPRLFKEVKRGLKRNTGELLSRLTRSSSSFTRSAVAPALCYVEMLLVDYGIARVPYNNRHRVSADVWRSAQPSPRHLAWAAKNGVKTIVNLRAEQTFGTRWLEERACNRNGLKLVDLPLHSRSAPSRQDMHAIKDVIARVEYPILLHCKSGADRAGLMSVMVRHVRDGVPIEKALDQLSWRYGHFRSADTGVLDAVFQRFLEGSAKTGISFWDWVDTAYDPETIKGSFRAKGWANRLVNGVLNRE